MTLDQAIQLVIIGFFILFVIAMFNDFINKK